MAEKDVMAILLLAGAGVGGYFLWKYLKGPEIPPPINPDGFVIVERYYLQDEKKVDFPISDKQFSVVIVGMNSSRTKIVDGYCKITNSDTQSVVFDEPAYDVDMRKTNVFTYTAIMPKTILKLTVETGRIINAEEAVDHSIELEIIPANMSRTELVDWYLST